MTEAPAKRRSWVAIGLFALGLLRYAPIVDRPWDTSLASVNGVTYMARMVRIWDEAGFAELSGNPLLFRLDIDPPVVDAYHHHPPLYPWLVFAATRLFGFNETGFRAVPIFFAALGLAALFVLLARRFGDGRALAASIAVGACPMHVLYGWMPNPESGVLAMCLVTAALHERLRERSLLAYVPAFVGYVVATQLDWQAYFFWPVIALGDGIDRIARNRRRSLLLVVAGTVSLAFTFAMFAVWNDSIGAAWTVVRDTVRASAAGVEKPGPASFAWWQNQGRFLFSLFGVGLLITGGAGLIVAVIGACRGDGRARWSLLWLLPALANVIVFRKHAFDHDFWWYYAIPAFAALTANLLRPAKTSVVLAVVLVVAIGGAFATWSRLDAWTSERMVADSKTLAKLLSPRDLLVRPPIAGPEIFYLPCPVFDRISDPTELEALAAACREGRVRHARVVFLFNESQRASFPKLGASLPALGAQRLSDEWWVVTLK